MNLNWIRAFFLTLLTVLSIVACISPTKVVPDGINIEKNRLIYRDVEMEIWAHDGKGVYHHYVPCLLYTSPSPRDLSTSRMPSSA